MAESYLKGATALLNKRFAPGDPLQEMVSLQKEWQVFREDKSLAQTYRLLNIVPSSTKTGRQFYAFLDSLKAFPSDLPGVNSHDRLIRVLQENLESVAPLPVHFTIHGAKQGGGSVVVTQGRPLADESNQYIIASLAPLPGVPGIPGPIGSGPKKTMKMP
jgi:hypothetical protein